MSQWKITYMGEGVQVVEGVGAFARNVRASVTEEIAKSLQGDSSWQVTAPDEAPPAPVAAPAAPAAEEQKPEAKADDKGKGDKK